MAWADTDGLDKTFQVCIIGAGMSGMCAAIQLKLQLNLENVTIFEEHEDIGGTWLVNKYPGCGCDVPGHVYSYSFEQNPGWSKNFVLQDVIHAYLRNVANKHDLYARIRFRHRVTELRWVDSSSTWKATVLNLNSNEELQLTFNVVISCVGATRVPSIPREFESFKGPKMHTAEWNTSIDIEDKVVAIIGSGASAVQLIPAIASKVKKLICYQRRPAWIFPCLQYNYSRVAQFAFKYIPGVMSIVRNGLFWYFEAGHFAFKMNTIFRKAIVSIAEFHLRRQVSCPLLRNKLQPTYEFGCKRVLLTNVYYPTFLRENVTLVADGIKQVTENSIIHNDNTCTKPDVLILATGFKFAELFAPMKIFCKEGENLLTRWKADAPTLYLGINTHIAPNLFFVMGPNTGPGHNSLLFMIECEVNWIVKVIRELQRRGMRSVSVKEKVEEDYMSFLHKEMDETVWGNSECGSWYVNEHGKNFVIWPKSTISYWNMTRRVHFDNFDFI